jgi:hypothetical protein
VHAAPPVRVRLGRSAGWIGFVAVCAGLATANLAAWGGLRLEGTLAMTPVLGAAVAALTAWHLRRSCVPSDLNWTGSEWQWQGLSGNAQVALDLDAWMLLRFESVHGKRCWIAASRKSAVGPWPALRAALYARRPADPLAP